MEFVKQTVKDINDIVGASVDEHSKSMNKEIARDSNQSVSTR
jgi:hypothetical protein